LRSSFKQGKLKGVEAFFNTFLVLGTWIVAKNLTEKLTGGALVTVTGDEPDKLHDPGNLPDDDAPAEVALSEVLAQLGEERAGVAKCMVWRIPLDAGADEEYLYEVSATDFARRGGVGDIAKRYGAGIYRIRVYSGGKIYTHKRVKIGAPIIQESNPGADMAALRSDMTSSMATLANAFKDGLTEVVKGFAGQNKPLSLVEQMRELSALKEMIGLKNEAPRSPLQQLKDMADLITTMKGIMPVSENNSGMGGALLRLGERFLPEIVEAVKKAAPGGSDHPGAPIVQDGRAIGESPDGGDMGAVRDLQLKMALDFLVDSAVRGLPVETYADVAVDKVPVPDLIRLLNRADWLAELNKIDARVLDHQVWFTKLRDEILTTLREAGALTVAITSPTMEGGTKIPPSNVS
jgi:hypothetical protein